MARTKISGVLFFLILFSPCFAFANIIVTEIMYDLPSGSDSGREWIEVQNVGAEPIDLTKVRLFENGTNHKITASGEKMLRPGVYAVIAANPSHFKTDWPNFAGIVFDSAFNLNNSGETIALNNASTTFDTVSYTSAMGGTGGNTLNREGQSFLSRMPSPGSSAAVDAFVKEVPVPSDKNEQPKKVSFSEMKEEVLEESVNTESVSGSEVTEQVASAVVANDGVSRKYVWWGSAFALALSSAGAIVFSRRYAKDEWEITEG